MLIYVNGFKHFLRLSTLPQGVRPGRVDIWNMIGNDVGQGGPRNSPNHGEEAIQYGTECANRLVSRFGKKLLWKFLFQ